MDNLSICVVTWYTSLNYGTCIQCYALTKILSIYGYSPYIIDSFKYYYGINHPVETLSRIISILKRKLTSTKKIKLSDDLERKYRIREEKNRDFAYSYNKIYTVNSKRELKKILESTDIFISGSDQIWNPNYVSSPFLLSFAPRGRKKIAYASSIGVNSIPPNKEKFYSKYLKSFDFIGVREETAKIALNRIVNNNIKVVLDPTFLLNKEEWTKTICKSIEENEENYVFCYFIGNNTSWMEDVKKLATKENLKPIIALSESRIIPDFGEVAADIGVIDFLRYILNAKMIITDSFHAVALSINLNKDFYVYERFKEGEKNSQNSRIRDVLKTFNLEDRLIKLEEKEIGNKKMSIDYSKVNKILEYKRKESIDLLLKNIAL